MSCQPFDLRFRVTLGGCMHTAASRAALESLHLFDQAARRRPAKPGSSDGRYGNATAVVLSGAGRCQTARLQQDLFAGLTARRARQGPSGDYDEHTTQSGRFGTALF